MSGPAVLLLITVILIVLALVYYLVSTIVALRQITSGLDATIKAVVQIIDKSKPVNEVVGLLQLLTLSSVHPLMATGRLDPAEIVSVVLDGTRRHPTLPDDPEER